MQKQQFLQFTAIEGKSYGSTREFKRRIKNWTVADNYINDLNLRNNGVTFKHNWISDLSGREKRKMLQARKPTIKTSARQVGYCGAGCEVCQDLNNCQTCFDSFTLNNGVCECATNQINYYETACMTCTSGQYWSDFLKRCVNCAANCSDCDDMKTCNACNIPYTLSANGVCTCSGFTGIDGSCYVCDQSG